MNSKEIMMPSIILDTFHKYPLSRKCRCQQKVEQSSLQPLQPLLYLSLKQVPSLCVIPSSADSDHEQQRKLQLRLLSFYLKQFLPQLRCKNPTSLLTSPELVSQTTFYHPPFSKPSLMFFINPRTN